MSKNELIALGLEAHEVDYIAEAVAKNGEVLGDIVHVDFCVSPRSVGVETVNEAYDLGL